MLLIIAVLRFLHITAGIFWAGAALLMNLVIAPAIGATGDAGKQFAGYLIGKTAFAKLMVGSALITVLAGTALYGIDSNWFSSGWMSTGSGIGFGIGAFAGILAFIFGILISKTNGALAALGAQIQGAPTPEQVSALQAIRKRQAFINPANTICMIIAIVLMASARFMG